MGLLAWFTVGLETLAAALAWRVALGTWKRDGEGPRRTAHRPVAVYLSWVAATEVVRAILAWLVLHPAREVIGKGVPYHGLARGVFHVDQALFMIGPVGLVIVALLAFLEQKAPRRGHIIGLTALLLAALVVSYPSSQGPAYEAWRGFWWPAAITGIHVVAQFVAWGSAAWWWRRNRGGWTDETSKIVMALACADLALFMAGVLPWAPFTAWHLGDAARAAILAWICWEQAAWIRSTQTAAS